MKPTVKSLNIKGTSGLTRRQKAAYAAMRESFPPLPAKSVPRAPAAPSFLSAPEEDLSFERYRSGAWGRKGGLRASGEYLQMLVNPFVQNGQRYPDETIVPTALVHFNASQTWTVNASAAAGGFYTYLNWKVRTAGVSDATFVGPTAFGGAVTTRDYGTPQSQWAALSSVDRSLALGLRVRHVGLPVSTFVPSGTLYFLQLQAGEQPSSVYNSETGCIAAVAARKGFSMTCAELSRLGNCVHIPYLPQGPMSYVFSNQVDAASGFPDAVTNQSVAPNNMICCIGFGLQEGCILRFDYAHHVEYIPTSAAAGLVEARVQTPSVADRERIAEGANKVIQVIAGGTSAMSSLPGIPTSPFGGGAGSTLTSMISSTLSSAGLRPSDLVSSLAGLFA